MQTQNASGTDYVSFQINQGTNFTLPGTTSPEIIVNTAGTYLVSLDISVIATGNNPGVWSGKVEILRDDGAGSYTSVSEQAVSVTRNTAGRVQIKDVVVYSSGSTKKLKFSIVSGSANGNSLYTAVDNVNNLTISMEKIA